MRSTRTSAVGRAVYALLQNPNRPETERFFRSQEDTMHTAPSAPRSWRPGDYPCRHFFIRTADHCQSCGLLRPTSAPQPLDTTRTTEDLEAELQVAQAHRAIHADRGDEESARAWDRRAKQLLDGLLRRRLETL